MERSISNFVETVDKQGFVDTTKYILYVSNGNNNELPESNTMYCINATIPGIQINTFQKYDAGPIRNIPLDANYPELQLQFYCSQDFYEYEYFTRWMEMIYGGDSNNINPYRMPYYDEIIGNVMLSSLDKKMNIIKDIVFYEAFPNSLGDISFAYENNSGEPAKFSVSLMYHHWEIHNHIEYIVPNNKRMWTNTIDSTVKTSSNNFDWRRDWENIFVPKSLNEQPNVEL